MRIYALSVLLAASLLGPTPSFAGSTAVPGAKCVRVGQSQIVGGKKLTCIKASSKLIWNKGVIVPVKAAPSADPSASTADVTPTSSPSPSNTLALVKFKNCTEAKAAGAAPLSKTKNAELYDLNVGLDRDKDGIACEN